jgi:hypothetical protein
MRGGKKRKHPVQLRISPNMYACACGKAWHVFLHLIEHLLLVDHVISMYRFWWSLIICTWMNILLVWLCVKQCNFYHFSHSYVHAHLSSLIIVAWKVIVLNENAYKRSGLEKYWVQVVFWYRLRLSPRNIWVARSNPARVSIGSI